MKTSILKKSLLAAALPFLSLGAVAQTTDTAQQAAALEKITRVELGLQGGGISYELPLRPRWSVNLGAGLGGGYSVYGNNFRSAWVLNQPVVYFKSEFKYVYNRSKRLEKSKSLLHNAGNYVAFQTKFTTRRLFGYNHWYEGDFLNKTLLNEVHWGIQRPLGDKFTFNVHVGLGYAHDFDFSDGTAYPAAGVVFGYVINNNR